MRDMQIKCPSVVLVIPGCAYDLSTRISTDIYFHISSVIYLLGYVTGENMKSKAFKDNWTYFLFYTMLYFTALCNVAYISFTLLPFKQRMRLVLSSMFIRHGISNDTGKIESLSDLVHCFTVSTYRKRFNGCLLHFTS